MIRGTVTAMITPFKNQQVDIEGLIQNIHDQLSAKVEGLLFLGTTGESPTLTYEEENLILETAVREIGHRALVLVGTGTNCTRKTIEKTNWAKRLGADVALVVSPYYNKPTQEGLYLHFEALSNACAFPILLYNHLGRCGVQISIETLLRVAALPHIIGVKETSSDENFLKALHQKILLSHPSFTILSGCDENTLNMIKMGSSGVISVLSNLYPTLIKQLIDFALEGKFKQAAEIERKLSPFMELAAIETNPIPIKCALSLVGKPSGPCRLPLSPLSLEHYQKLEHYFKEGEIHSQLKEDLVIN